MAGTRRSTRQKTTDAPKYNENDDSSPAEDKSARAGKKGVKRGVKRARARADDTNNDNDDRDEDEEDIKESSPLPPKKKKRTTQSNTKAKASPKSPQESTKPSTTTPTKPPSTLPNPTNRLPDGSQETFWLLKAEPLPRYENGINVSFSISDLAACTAPEPWSGVRNPQARNNMLSMRAGDLGFFYHSNAKPSGVVGVLRVVEEAKVDETAFDAKDPYYDPKSERGKPKWWCVGVEFVEQFEEVVDLKRIKGYAGKGGELEGMQLVTNSRLSVSRVNKKEWEFILGLAKGGEEGKKEEGDE